MRLVLNHKRAVHYLEKMSDRGNFTSTSCQRLRCQNTTVEIGLIELAEPSDTWNYEPFSKHSVLQTILQVFLLFIFA